METPGAVHWMLFTQLLMLALVVHVSVGVYGCYYIVRSLAVRDHGHYVVQCQRAAHPDGPTNHNLPGSARELPFLGLLIFGLFGVVAVVLLLILAVVGSHSAKVRTLILMNLFFDRKLLWYQRS